MYFVSTIQDYQIPAFLLTFRERPANSRLGYFRRGFFRFTLPFVAGCAIGGTGDAASYQFDVRYIDTIYTGVKIYPHGEDPNDEIVLDQLSSRDDQWNLPLLFDTLRAGRVYRLSYEHRGGAGVTCQLGPYDCSTFDDGYYAYYDGPTSFGEEESYLSFSGPMAVGTQIYYWDIDYYPGFDFITDLAIAQVHDRHTIFEVARIPSVPLPASAAFLFAGLGGIASLRKTRRDGKRPAS